MANPRSKDPAKNQASQKFSGGAASPAKPVKSAEPAMSPAPAVPKPANEIKPAATRAVSPIPPKLEPAKSAAEINPAAGINPLADALRSAVVKHRIEATPAAGANPVAEVKPVTISAPAFPKPAVETKPAVAPTAAKSTAAPLPSKLESVQSVAASPSSRPTPVAGEAKPTPPKIGTPAGAIASVPPAVVTAKAPIAPVKPEPVVSPMLVTVVAPSKKNEPSQKPLTPKPLTPPVPPISEQAVVEEIPKLKKTEPEPGEPKPSLEVAPPPPPAIPSMFVVMIASELTPVAKVGGLADVVYGLARELETRGNAVEIILPKYDCMRYDHIYGLTKAYENLWVPWYGGGINTTVYFGFVHGRKCYFIEPHSNDNFFNRKCFYGQNDDVLRFAFFCRAALEFMLKTNKHPEIIHCHDWQTALVPVLLYEMYQHLGMRHSRVCFTVHNFKHQGVTGDHVLRGTGLNRPEYFLHYDRLRDNHNPHAINLMKGGMVYSNFVNTVSPRHAWEAKDGGQAHGLEPTLNTHQHKFGGILNGLDYEQFNPQTDPHIPTKYSADTIEKKYENKQALRRRFLLADNAKPIISFVGRLDPQKGLELVRHAIFYALGHGAQFVLLGSSPNASINEHFLGLKRHFNDNPDCHLEIAYNEEAAHLIYAGADMIVVPSRYEPCGLTQIIAMAFGTVPVVRAVGGLADTVFDKDFSNRPLHERNGYVFETADNPGLESALQRAIACYYQFPEHFRQLLLNGMRGDHSWNHPAQHYLNIYDFIRDK
jgi:starch synthase